MHIVTIVEDSPITGVRYGTVEISQYNNNTQRRIDRRIRFYRNLRNLPVIKTHRTHSK